jgi:hypothetical protein
MSRAASRRAMIPRGIMTRQLVLSVHGIRGHDPVTPFNGDVRKIRVDMRAGHKIPCFSDAR